MEHPSRDGWITAYVYNADHPDFSEIGDIQVEAVNGRLSVSDDKKKAVQKAWCWS